MGGVMEIIQAPWVGFRYFGFLFKSEYFWRLLRNTLVISGLRLVFEFPAPIILALLLNEITFFRFRKVVQTITYLPHFLSCVVVAGVVTLSLSPIQGPVNAVIKALGAEPIAFLADNRYFRGVLVVSSIWHEVGWGSIIYLAAISNVPQEQYEAAGIEGASRWQRARYVTLPSIAFIIVIFLILRVGRIIDENFEQIFNLYNPSVYEVSDVFETYIYRRGLLQSDFSYATAVGLFKSVTSLVLVAGANWVAKLLGQESLW
jgi:putative aldouronate transport system permease protein